ncbi:MAG: hypothetical protein ACREC0_10265 [Methylocella sp.]
MIDYDPAGPDREPVFRWVDDNTLCVDLGKIYWVSSRLDKDGNIRVI